MNLKPKLLNWSVLLRKNRFIFLKAFCILTSIYLTSCQSTQEEEQIPPRSFSPIVTDMPIMGQGKANFVQLENFFLKNNSKVNKAYLDDVTNAYLQECRAEGVNSDVAFVQMCHETKFLRFGNQVKQYQNNFAGIGATDDGAKGASFKTINDGVRAQIQHLKAYASKTKLNGKLIDPRFYEVKRGSAAYVSQLGKGRWASDPNYARKILYKINELYRLNGIR